MSLSDIITLTKNPQAMYDKMLRENPQFAQFVETNKGKTPEDIAKENNMVQVSDNSLIMGWIKEVLDANPQTIDQYKAGRTNVLGFLVGQVIKKSQGQANPGLVNKLLREEIEK